MPPYQGVLIGKYANPFYQKAAERREKREREDKRVLARVLDSKRGRYQHSHRGFGRGDYGQGRNFGQASGHQGNVYSNYMAKTGGAPPNAGLNVKCYNCQGYGHWANNCPQKGAPFGANHK